MSGCIAEDVAEIDGSRRAGTRTRRRVRRARRRAIAHDRILIEGITALCGGPARGESSLSPMMTLMRPLRALVLLVAALTAGGSIWLDGCLVNCHTAGGESGSAAEAIVTKPPGVREPAREQRGALRSRPRRGLGRRPRCASGIARWWSVRRCDIAFISPTRPVPGAARHTPVRHRLPSRSPSRHRFASSPLVRPRPRQSNQEGAMSVRTRRALCAGIVACLAGAATVHAQAPPSTPTTCTTCTICRWTPAGRSAHHVSHCRRGQPCAMTCEDVAPAERPAGVHLHMVHVVHVVVCSGGACACTVAARQGRPRSPRRAHVSFVRTSLPSWFD